MLLPIFLTVMSILIVVGQDFPYVYQFNARNDDNGEELAICSAVLVYPSWAITAALCAFDIRVDLLSIANESILMPLKNVVVYPEYNMTDDSQIALLQLASPCEGCKTISLPSSAPKPDDVVTVAGWSFSNVSSTDFRVMSANISVISHDDCSDIYKGMLNISEVTAFCAENYFDQYSPIEYMLPGGAVLENEKLVGIIAYDRGIFDPDLPGIYSNVSDFMGWINETIDSFISVEEESFMKL